MIPAHPFAGQKDSEMLCKTFSEAWEAMINSGAVTERKAKKSVHLVNGKLPSNKKKQNGKRFVAKPKRPVDEKTCCYRCGGLGHVAKMTLTDGTVLMCATQMTIPKDILFGIKYPHIASAEERRDAYRSSKNGAANEVKEEEAKEEEAEEEEQVEEIEEADSSDEESQYANQLNG